MTRQRDKKLLLAGYADELTPLVRLIDTRADDIALVTENASDDDVPKSVDVVVFVTSLDTCYSTRLHSLFVYVCDRVSAREKYLLPVGDFDVAKFVFPELAHLPRIEATELASVVLAR
jgi:hypothetical protein